MQISSYRTQTFTPIYIYDKDRFVLHLPTIYKVVQNIRFFFINFTNSLVRVNFKLHGENRGENRGFEVGTNYVKVWNQFLGMGKNIYFHEK